MRTLVVALVCAALLAPIGEARAAEISSTPIFGVVFQFLAECVVLNGGNNPVSVKLKIVGSHGDLLEAGNCYGSLGPGEFCSIVAGWQDGLSLGDGHPVSCVATAPSVANLRGAMVMHERVNDGMGGLLLLPMRSAPLR